MIRAYWALAYCVIGLLFLVPLTSCHTSKPLIVKPIPGSERNDLINQHLTGKRIGLIVNQSSLVGGQHVIDAFLQNGLNVTKLFAVEHGIRGTHDAGATIKNGRDQDTSLPIISIYGKNKAPSKSNLEDLDIMVFDLQDVGVRFFTYLSSLHFIMESCALYDTPLVVLDRPNPNISYIDGPILEPEFRSFVGMHPIPLMHGMTLGELAQMINGEAWLSGGVKCDLTVIPVQNYTRSTSYILPVKPSPNLPNQQAIKLYPSLALFEATNISVGRGTEFPFQVLGGMHREYGNFTFVPKPTLGSALNPKLNGQTLYGEDLRHAQITGFQIELFLKWYDGAQKLNANFLTRADWLDKLMGTSTFRKQIEANFSADDIRASWAEELKTFKKRRASYLLYKE